MATHTLRPTTMTGDAPYTLGAVMATPVGGTWEALGLDDDSLATYWNFLAYQEGYRSYLALRLSELDDLVAGERVRSVRVRIRTYQGNDVPASSYLTTHLFLAGGVPSVLSELDVMARPEGSVLSQVIEGAEWPLAPDGEPWTVQRIADLRLAVYMDQFKPTPPQSWPTGTDYFSNPTRLYEVWVDVTTNVAPSTTISAPSGDQTYDDASTTKGSATLTSATAAFTADDDGLTLVGQGRGDDTFADGSGSYVLASPTAAFTSDDVGLEVQAGNALSTGAVISEIVDPSHARLSEAMRLTPRTVSDARYSGPVTVRINTLAGSPIVWLSAPSYDSPFLDCAGVPSLGTDIGRRIVGPGIPAGATISALVNPFGVGCVGSYYAGLSANATRTVSDSVAEKVGDTVESATAAFTADDVGALIYGADIPTGATITAVLSATLVRISIPVAVEGEAKSISIARPVPASAPVSFTIRSRLAVRRGTVTYVSATQVTLANPAVLTLTDQTFTLVGRAEVITDVNRPLIQVSFGDPEGDTVVAWLVKVFTAAQIAAVGFDPDNSASLYDSGELVPSGRSAEHRVTTALPDGALHRFYAKGSDSAGYGAWAWVDFTLAVPLPAVPTLSSVMPDDTLARVGLGVTADEGVADAFNRANSSSTMGSTDTGEAWSPQSGTWGIASNKGYLAAAASRSVSDGVTYLHRVVDDGVTQIERAVIDGVTSIARTVTDGVTTVGRTVTDGQTSAAREVTGCYRGNDLYGNASIWGYLNPQPPRYVFSASDVGKSITGSGIPAGTTILSVYIDDGSGLHGGVRMSQDWTASGGPITVTIGGNITVHSATAAFVAGDVGKPIVGGTLPLGTTIQSRTSATEVITTATTATPETGLTIHIGGLIVTSATAAFVTGDVGKPISGGSIPGFALIVARQSATAVQISLPATTAATGVTVTLSGMLLTSATAQFTQADVGKAVTGSGIPAATTIVWVTGGSSVIMTAAATASATGVSVTIGDSTVVDSATAVFVAGDVGKPIAGDGIPAGATVASRTSATRVVISAAATLAGSSITLTIGYLDTTVDSATAAFVAADLGKKIVGGSLPAGTTVAAIVSGTRVTVSAGATAAATAVSLTISGQESTLVEAGVVDVDVVESITLDAGHGLALRALNGSNLLFARLTPGTVEIWKRQASALTRLASSQVTAVVGGTYRLLFRAEGRQLTAFLDGVAVASATLSFAEKALFTGAGYTKVGQHTNADTVSRFENFLAIPSALALLVERSNDDGTTWLPVRPFDGTPVTDFAARTVYDYEMRRARRISYRVKASRSSVAPVYSTASTTRIVRVDTLGVAWLKDPNDPDVNVRLVDSPDLESESDEAQSVVYALARADAIVRSSVVRAEHFSNMELYTEDNAAFAAFEALRQRMRPLLFQTCYGDSAETGADQFYLRIGKRQVRRLTTSEGDIANGQRRLITIDAVEVASPA